MAISIIVISGVLYQICAKSLPSSINLFVSIAMSYSVAAILSIILYLITRKSGSLPEECRFLNWSSFALGIALVGMETGVIHNYKAGWEVSTGSMISTAPIAVAMFLIGSAFYHEAITPKKIFGIAICILGLYFISK